MTEKNEKINYQIITKPENCKIEYNVNRKIDLLNFSRSIYCV